MKNKLIIITSTIGRMGGAQMYVENKVKYFQSKGWEVYVFYFYYAEKILLPGLEAYRENYFPDLQYPIQYIPRCRRNSIIAKIKNIVKPEGGNVIVESQLISSAYWGELIAKAFNGKNILNLLEEQIPVFSEKENEFFHFKIMRDEIMNAALSRLHSIFKNRFREEYCKHVRNIVIPCANVVAQDVEDPYQFDCCDYTILSIGRLDKPYIPTMNEEVKKFASMIGDKKINMVYIGGSHDGTKEIEIPRFFDNVKNVNCYMLGYVYPIPQSLIKRSDIAIACANSVLVSANEGVPTIVVDINDYSAVGIYGSTTNNKFKRSTEKIETISSLLMQVLVEQSIKTGINTTDLSSDKVFEEEMSYFLNNKELRYFDVESIYSIKTKLISRTKYLIRKLFNIRPKI